MNRFVELLRHTHSVSVIGLALALGALYAIASIAGIAAPWLTVAILAVVLAWIGYWVVKWQYTRQASGAMARMFNDHVETAAKTAPAERKQDVEMLRKRLLEAVTKIKTSKLGQLTGSAALYEMPWYVVIGNPAAGKSTAIVNSGLNFPFSDNGGQALQGVGGTRNCDWFFTTEGILLDTAGRYAINDEDRNEWLGFLDLLKKYRPKAPINGIVIVASIAELTGNRPDHTIELAKQLRQRVQELTERLELFVPVYIMFTKVDLIAGFVDFFENADAEERGRVWGATLPYETATDADALGLFDRHFDLLADGLKELGTTRMSLDRSQAMSPGVLTFPLEFSGVRAHLRTFIATLFEDNPFQFKPIFRGFYFTSAIQEGIAAHATGQRIVQQYGLSVGRRLAASVSSNTGFFLKNLFSAVIFADRHLVRQYTSRAKLIRRKASFYAAVLALGVVLSAWSWSFLANRQYVANVRADLENAVKMQQAGAALASRMAALETLQDRLEQLLRYRTEKPLSLGFGLYQGERIEHKLRAEYFNGMREIMLGPVTANLEAFLAEVNANAGKLEPPSRPQQSAQATATLIAARSTATPASASPYKDLSALDPADAYNALKTYLMLAHRDRADPAHLGDQITRFWRTWLEANRGGAPREQVIRSAEKLITFYISQAREPDFPVADIKMALAEQTRETLRVAVKGMPARERVYNDIKMRASTRFPGISVASVVGEPNRDIVAGSHAVPGAFTRDAWDQFIEGAIKEASTRQLQTTDWVLQTSARDDLTMEGSPEQIQRELVRQYKAEYAAEWKKFMQGVTIPDFASFDKAVESMNRLGDPSLSPLNVLVQTIYRETSWDNPSAVNRGLQQARRSATEWFRTTILRQPPAQSSLSVRAANAVDSSTGMIGKEFTAVASLTTALSESKDTSLLQGYLGQLSKVRARLNQIANSGDIGPASRQLMQATLNGSGSEIAEALKYVDDSVLAGMPPAERAAIRPLLVRPLMQAFAAIVSPTEQEIDRTWRAQVFEPFGKSLGAKYPFAPDSRVEATASEIALVFGPDGAIAKFVQTAMEPLVVRRGDTLAARTWADMGIRLNPEFAQNLPRFVAAQASAGSAGSAAAQPQTSFQLQPQPTPGLVEYTIDIDGQTMRYRNGRQEWFNFTWPSALGAPGARISAVTADGRSIVIADFPGQFGLEKLVNAARRNRLEEGMFTMAWEAEGARVTVNFRLVSDARAAGTAGGNADVGLRGLRLPPTVIAAAS